MELKGGRRALIRRSCSTGFQESIKSHIHLVCIVRSGPASVHAVRCHDSPQVVPLHQQFINGLSALFVNVNDGSGNLRYSLNHHLPAGENQNGDEVERCQTFTFLTLGTELTFSTTRSLYQLL